MRVRVSESEKKEQQHTDWCSSNNCRAWLPHPSAFYLFKLFALSATEAN